MMPTLVPATAGPGPTADRTMGRSDIGELLAAVDRKEPGAWDSLMALVYEDLKRIARAQMRRITPGQTLTTTVLVHESFEKLAAQQALTTRDRVSFYALCACAMRQIIIDHYRRRAAKKRSLDQADALAEHEVVRSNPDADHAMEALGRVLDELAQRDEALVQVFEMRHFAGLSVTDIAQRLNVSTRTVQRNAARAQAWVVAALDS